MEQGFVHPGATHKQTETRCTSVRQLILRLNELNDRLSQAGPTAGLAQAFDGRRTCDVSLAELTPATRHFTCQLHPSDAPSHGRSDMKQSRGWFPATGATWATRNHTASEHSRAALPAGQTRAATGENPERLRVPAQ